MLASFPNSGVVEVSSALGAELLKTAERLPHYDNKEFYSFELQTEVRNRIRSASPAGFDWLVGVAKEHIEQWPYCLLIRGLEFDEGNRLFVALNRAFGELVARPYQKPRAQLVHYVQPATDLPSARGGCESERLHTDTADWERPVELISMVCVRADREGGGRSRVLDVDAVREEVKTHLGNEALSLLESEPVPWQLADYRGGGTKWRCVLNESGMCWRRYTIDLAVDREGAQLSETMTAALDAFDEVLANTDRTLDFLMREGDWLLSDNTRTIHARTPVAAGAASDRLMIRSWIRTEKGTTNAVCSTV